MMKKFLCFVVLCCLSVSVWAESNFSFPRLTGQVVDEANILSLETEQKIISMMTSQQQFIVVTLESLGGQEIEEYGVALGRHWGIGQAGVDDGLLLIVAPNEHQTRIEVGYGLEHIMTDAESSYIVQNILLPAFRKNQYEAGILAAVSRIQAVLNGTAPKDVYQNSGNMSQGLIRNFQFIFFASFWYLILFMFPKTVIKNITKKTALSKKDEKILKWAYKTRNLLIFCVILMVLNFLLWQNEFIFIALLIIPHMTVLFGLNGPGIRRSDSFHGGGRSFGGGSSFHGGGGSFGGGGSSGRW